MFVSPLNTHLTNIAKAEIKQKLKVKFLSDFFPAV